MIPPVYALMNVANSVLCPLLFPKRLQDGAMAATAASNKMAIMAFTDFFISQRVYNLKYI